MINIVVFIILVKQMEEIKNILSRIGLFDIVRKVMIPFLYKMKSNKLNKNGLKSLDKIIRIFEKNKINYWLECGTLLGAIREKNFLKHDLDIDIGLEYLNNEKVKEIQEILLENNFKLRFEIYIKDTKEILHQCYIDMNNVQIDLDFYKTDSGIRSLYEFSRLESKSYGQTVKEYGGLVVWKYDFNIFETIESDFKSLKVRVPKNYEEILEKLYGEDWRIPKKNWNVFKESPKRKLTNNKGIIRKN